MTGRDVATREGTPDTTSRRGLLMGLPLGLPVVAFGLRGVLVDSSRTHPAELARWLIGAALVHDLVLVPLALAAGCAARRVTPARLWPVVRSGLLVTAALALVSWPFVRGYGQDPANPSLLPREHGAGLAAAIGVVWVAVAAWGLAATLRSRARRSERGPRPAAPGAPRPARGPSGPPR